MMNRLFILGRFAHDPQSVSTAIHRLALVSIELCLDIVGLELGITALTYPNGGRCSLYDPQLALLHNGSLAHLAGRA